MDDEVPTRRARRDELLVHLALRAKARTYEETVARWAAQPPSDAQVRALRDLVSELQTLVTDADTGRSSAAARTLRER